MRDRRNAERKPAEGTVRLWLDSPARLELEGRLLDLSATGFRAAHQYARLETGQEVGFKFLGTTGRARVVWNRISPDRVETGFVLI